MKSHHSYSMFAVLVAGLACTDIFAQSANSVPAGNPAFGTFSYRVPSRPAELQAPVDEVVTESVLIETLFSELRRLSKYPKGLEHVTVTRLPHAELEAIVCKKSCGVLGFYRDGQIFLDDKLKPESNVYDRSVLLHELLHYLQDVNLAYGADANCDRWYLREMEAYTAQQQFLYTSGSPVHLMFAGMRSLCRDDTVRQAILDKH